MPGENLKEINPIRQASIENGITVHHVDDEHINDIDDEDQLIEAKIEEQQLVIKLTNGLVARIPVHFLPHFNQDYPLPDEAELLILRRRPAIDRVFVNDAVLTVYLKDGRVLAVPLAWFPRLVLGTPEERNHYYLGGLNDSIHWPDLDEDIGLDGLFKMTGKSCENNKSILRWFEEKQTAHATEPEVEIARQLSAVR